jgi:hypothetical protein
VPVLVYNPRTGSDPIVSRWYLYQIALEDITVISNGNRHTLKPYYSLKHILKYSYDIYTVGAHWTVHIIQPKTFVNACVNI